jgi:hypothetical protein
MREVSNPGRRAPAALLAALLVTAGVLVAALGAGVAHANGVAFEKGDVLAGTGNGKVSHFSPTGTLRDTLETESGAPEDTGMCFDAAGSLYTTNFAVNSMSVFDSGGNLITKSFGSGFNEHPESCAFNASSDVFVGQADGEHHVLEFNTKGESVASFAPETAGQRGTDWVDLAGDQCTLNYAGEGSEIRSYNLCTKTQLTAVATGLPAPCFAHRILSDGSELVACSSAVEHVNAKGEIIKTYELKTAGGEPVGNLFALNLDPDGKSFWTAQLQANGEIWRVDIATGTTITQFNSGAPVDVAGLAVVGEVTPQPKIELAPKRAENPVGTKHTVTATVTEEGTPAAEKEVTFTVTGANPQTGKGTTNAKGEATFTYEGKTEGTDEITASFVDKDGHTVTSNTVTKVWTKPKVEKKPTTTTTSLSGEGKSGESITVKEGTAVTDQATLVGANASKAGGKVTYKVYSDEACSVLVKEAGTVTVSGGVVPASEAETLAPGTYYWQASYGGDEANEKSSSKCGVEVETVTAAIVAKEAFVVGDLSVGTGETVNFWGAQWAKNNEFSGGRAPASMKGFADNVSALKCGATWTTRPGNSSKPPTTLPSEIDVIVSSAVTKSGSTISGTILHIVVVQVNPGYGPDPGHAGFGKVVERVC